jgi:hypothetical protein
MKRSLMLVASLVGGLAIPAALSAQLINNATVTIINGLPGFPGDNSWTGYQLSNAIDAAGAATPYCTESGNTNTFIVFDFGAAINFSSIGYTGTECSGNVTGFNYLFSNQSNLGSPVGSAGYSQAGSISTASVVTPFTARYVEWQVTSYSTGSGNNGAADFQFYGTPAVAVTPEPATMTMLATGLLGITGAGIRRRKRAGR